MVESEKDQNPGEFYIEVFEKSADSSGQWIFAKEIHRDGERPTSSRIYTIENENFSSLTYVANLTEWAGKNIRLDLVSKLPKDFVYSNVMGRWVKANLIGSTFRIKFGPKIIVEQEPINTLKTKKIRTNPASVSITSVTMTPRSATEAINPPGLSQAEGLGVINYNNNWYGYFNCNGSGTALYDLSTSTFFNATAYYIQGRVVRGTTYNNAAPGTTGDPFYILSPSSSSTWYNRYVGMGTGFSAYINSTDLHIHGYLHAEHEFSTSHVYMSIGYARSSGTPHPYRFEIMHDSNSTSPNPIITSYQSQISSATCGLYGNGAPTVIRTGDYYYIFYTRLLDVNQSNYDDPPYYGSSYSSMCIARAPVNDVTKDNYSSSTHPWRKFLLLMEWVDMILRLFLIHILEDHGVRYFIMIKSINLCA